MAHAYHDQLPGYDPRQILVDGCHECEERSKDLDLAILKLDEQRWIDACNRAKQYALADVLDDTTTGPISDAERPLLRVLWAVEVMHKREKMFAKIGK